MTTVEPIRSKKDIEKVTKQLVKQGRLDLLLFEIGINCGLRISDILRLNVGDVRNRNYIQITEKKTGKFKKFPINAKLKPLIEDFCQGRRDKEPLFLSLKCNVTHIKTKNNRPNGYTFAVLKSSDKMYNLTLRVMALSV